MKQIINFYRSVLEKGFFHVLIGNFLFGVVAFGAQLLVAKFITDEELGYVKVFQSFIQVASIAAGMGFSTSVLILSADKRNENRKEEILWVAIYAVLPISLIIWLTFLALNSFDLWSQIPKIKELFHDYSFIIIITALTAIFTAFFQAARQFKKYACFLIVAKICSLVIMVILTYFYGIKGFMNGLWIGLLFSMLFLIFYSFKNFGLNKPVLISGFYRKVKEHFSIGLHGMGANIFGMLANNMDIIILSFLLIDPNLLGQYSFAAIFISGLGMIQTSVVQISIPYFSKHLEDRDYLKRLYRKYMIILVAVSLGLSLILYLVLPILIEFFYGGKFQTGTYFLKLLLLVWFFRCSNALNISFLNAKGKTKYINLNNFILASLSALIIYASLVFFNMTLMVMFIAFLNALIFILYLYQVQTLNESLK